MYIWLYVESNRQVDNKPFLNLSYLIVADAKYVTSYVGWIGAQRRIFERLLIFGGHLGFLHLYNIAQTFASGTQRVWVRQVEIM